VTSVEDPTSQRVTLNWHLLSLNNLN